MSLVNVLYSIITCDKCGSFFSSNQEFGIGNKTNYEILQGDVDSIYKILRKYNWHLDKNKKIILCPQCFKGGVNAK
jgi:hypothetical protein